MCYTHLERELQPCPLSDNPLAEGTVTPNPRDIASDWPPALAARRMDAALIVTLPGRPAPKAGEVP